MLLGKMLQRAAQDRELARLVRPALQQVFIAVFEDPLADLADAERVRLWQAASACYADFSRLCQPRLREHVALASTLAAAVRRAPLSTALSRALDQLLALQESHANPKKVCCRSIYSTAVARISRLRSPPPPPLPPDVLCAGTTAAADAYWTAFVAF